MKAICLNRKAKYDYHILDTLECGIVLIGTEVKSLLQGKVSIEEAYATIENDEVWLINSDIQEYENARRENHKPKRQRKLLLHRDEIKKFAEKGTSKGFTLIPLSMYFANKKVKVELAVCQGKKKYDKRQAEKEKTAHKEIKAY
jgi:SsrA-binding protein